MSLFEINVGLEKKYSGMSLYPAAAKTTLFFYSACTFHSKMNNTCFKLIASIAVWRLHRCREVLKLGVLPADFILIAPNDAKFAIVFLKVVCIPVSELVWKKFIHLVFGLVKKGVW